MISNKKFAQFMMACKEDRINNIMQSELSVQKMINANNGDKENEELPYIYQVVGNVAVIEIKGQLVNRDSWYNQYAGLLSYNEIRRAYAKAYTDPEVKYILEDYDTPGGYVTGMNETADFMKAVGKVKPRYAFIGSTAASAGYYLAMGADEIYISPMAEAGSIGVVLVNMEYSEALKEDGIGVTIVRSGDLKMVGNPYEKLSEESKQYFNEQVLYTADLFFGNLQMARGITAEAMKQNDIQSGRTYIGKQAVMVGLADDIDTFDNILALLQKKVDNTNQGMNNGNNSLILTANQGGEMKKVLLAAEVAALAAGAPITASGVVVPDDAALQAAEKERLDKEAADKAALEASVSAAAADTILTVETQTPTAVDILKEQLKLAQDAKTELEIKVSTMAAATAAVEAKLVAAENDATSLKNIAAAATNNMLIALGRTTEDFSSSLAAAVSSRHSAVLVDFTKAFKVGSVSAAVDGATTQNTKGSLNPAQIKAVGFEAN